MNKSTRALSNLKMLEFVARKFGNLNNQVVYLGGCTTALLITDPLSLDVRTTYDVDCIIDVLVGEYYQFQTALREKGFQTSMTDDIVCRWHYDEIIIDIMPTDEKILGFGNRWFKEAMHYAVSYILSDDLIVRGVTAPYFLATKIEAFKTRGNNDFLGSHDFEDMITVIAGRKELVDEIISSDPILKHYIQETFADFLNNDQFNLSLPGHLNYGPVTRDRVKMVSDRIKKMVENR